MLNEDEQRELLKQLRERIIQLRMYQDYCSLHDDEDDDDEEPYIFLGENI